MGACDFYIENFLQNSRRPLSKVNEQYLENQS